ncbi:MAG TPA: DUF2339 domain-containing protein [Bordetella sp.]
MRWFIGILAFVGGALFALNDDLPVYECAIAFAVVGFVLTTLVGRSARQAQGASAPEIQAPRTEADPEFLAVRISRLEQELAQIRLELSQRRPLSSDAQPPSMPVAPDTGALGATTADARAVTATAQATAASSMADAMQANAAPPDTDNIPATDQPPLPAAVRQPGILERGLAATRDWFLGGNTVVRVGIVVLFFGIAFLLKYAADNDIFPIEFRLAGVALCAIALLVTGWRLRGRRQVYGLVLQGGAVGMLYLVIFAATRLYGLLPSNGALPLMIAVCALSAILAIRQDAPALAFMGSAGGFLAPILLSTGGGSHIMLFGYYALLNAGILGIAWFKAWRPLNLLGFVCTFGIGAAWGATAYQPELFASAESFLLLFFLMYVGVALLYAIRRDLALTHYVDGTLVFGTPLLASLMQARLVYDLPFGLAYSAVALAAFYLGLAVWLRRSHPRLNLLGHTMLALAIIFMTLAIPAAFSGPTTTAVWALEGAAAVWINLRQRRLIALIFGLLLQLGAAFVFLGQAGSDVEAAARMPVLNGEYLATLFIGLAALFSGWRLHGKRESGAWLPWLPQVGIAAAAWGLLWWLGGGLEEIQAFHILHPDMPFEGIYDAVVLFILLTAWLLWGAQRVLNWPLAKWPAAMLAPALAVLSVVISMDIPPLSEVPALPVALALSYLLLHKEERDDLPPRLLDALHTLSFWTLCGLLTVQAFYQMGAWVPEGAWQWSAWAYGYGLALLLLVGPGAGLAWPVQQHSRAYLVWGAAPLALLLWAWSLASVVNDGDASPLFYLPILNPLDVAQLLAALAVANWMKRLGSTTSCLAQYGAKLRAAAALTGFIWLNAVLLRTLHHWSGVDYRLEALGASTLVQASVSVFWTICALATMIMATRRAGRTPWFAGACLLAITIVKLFLFDLSYLAGVSRIVAFIGIGLLLLLIGYFSPLPPKQAATEAHS